MTTKWLYQSAAQLQPGLKQGPLSSRALPDTYLSRIEAKNPALNAVIATDVEAARLRADAADRAISNGGADDLTETVSATPDKTRQKPADGKDTVKRKAGKQLGCPRVWAWPEGGRHRRRSASSACRAACGKCLAPDGAQAYTAWDDIDIAEKVADQVGFFT